MKIKDFEVWYEAKRRGLDLSASGIGQASHRRLGHGETALPAMATKGWDGGEDLNFYKMAGGCLETRGAFMIEIRTLSVSVEEKRILNNVNLHIGRGETVALFGPNGSGKTSLLKTIMGIPQYRVESGAILFRGKDICKLSIDERARLGIGIVFQHPPAVRGVRLGDLLRICMERNSVFREESINESAKSLNFTDFLERDINLGFSGGEIKRSELLQVLVQNPAFVMLDEPDSGVDLVNINLVGKVINELLEKDKRADKRNTGGLIITHAGHILDYVNADRAYVMLNGTVSCSGNPRDILEDIRVKGYEECVRCRREC